MLKNIAIVLGVCCLLFGCSGIASASIVMNFESPDFSKDNAAGNHSHSYSSSLGAVTFNGRIWHALNGSSINDNTPPSTGIGYFLKNVGTAAGNKVTMTFSFDVWGFDLYWLGVNGANMHGAIYDIYGNMIGTEETDTGNGNWKLEHVVDDSSSPIRSIAFWTTNNNGGFVGNKMAVDDITLNTTNPVPEPASLSLLGLGLAGLLKLRRKKI